MNLDEKTSKPYRNTKREKSQLRPGFNSAFTIVELLIVVVVIAILAAITVVSYNGIMNRAKVSAAQSDLRNLYNKMEIFKVNNGRYPRVAVSSTPPHLDLEEVIRGANLYGSTRFEGEKAFIFCGNPDSTKVAIVASHISEVDPYISIESLANLKFFYIDASGTGEASILPSVAEESGSRGAAACMSIDSEMILHTWSFNVPTARAP